MNIIHRLDDLPEEHHALAHQVIQDICDGSSFVYRNLEDDHPVKYCAWVIEQFALENMHSDLKHYVPDAAFADPQLALNICKLQPSLVQRIPHTLVQQHHPMIFELIEASADNADRLKGGAMTDAFIERAISLPVFERTQTWDDKTARGARALLVRASQAFWTPERALEFVHHVPDVVIQVTSLKNHIPVQLAVLQNNPHHYRDLSWDLRTDPAILEQLLSNHGQMIEHAPWHIQADPHWAQVALQNTPKAYPYVDSAIASNREVALQALERSDHYGFMDVVRAIPQRLKADLPFCHQLLDVMEQRELRHNICPHIDPTVLLNDGFTRRLCTLQPKYLEEIHQNHPRGIWHLEEHAAALCAQNLSLLKKAPLTADRAFCRKVLDHALTHFESTMRVLGHMNDKGIVLDKADFVQILQDQPSSYLMFPEAVRADPQVVLALLKTNTENTNVLESAFKSLPSSTFENNEPLLHTFLDHFINPTGTVSKPERFRSYEVSELMDKLVPPMVMQQLQTDMTTAERFMERHPKLYPFLGDELKEHPPFFERYLQVHEGMLSDNTVPKLMRTDERYALMAVQRNCENYMRLPTALRADQNIAWQYAIHTVSPSGIPPTLTSDTDWVLKVCEKRQDARLVEYASPSIKGLITKTQRQLQQSNPQVSLQDATLHLAAKRTAQADHKALKSAFKEAPRPAARPVANRPMGRSL